LSLLPRPPPPPPSLLQAASKLYPCSTYFVSNIVLETLLNSFSGFLYSIIVYYNLGKASGTLAMPLPFPLWMGSSLVAPGTLCTDSRPVASQVVAVT